MSDLVDGQFELDGAVSMFMRDGGPDLRVMELDTGSGDVRAQDADNPVGDGTNFGRDYLSSPSWTFTVGVTAPSPSAASAKVDMLEGAWRNEQVRSRPGAASVLRYQVDGVARRVYGRGRGFTRTNANLRQGFMQAVGEFILREPFTFDDTESGAHLGLVAVATTGTVLPVVLPVVLGVPAGIRRGVVNVEGAASTPMRVVISGPTSGHLTSPAVKGHGWRVELPGLQVAYDEQVVIDTRDRTVEKNGVSVARFLSRKSDLTARLNTGSQEIVFTATDPTNTAAAHVFWRPAHYSL